MPIDEETDVSASGIRQLMAGMVGGGIEADIGKTYRFATGLDAEQVSARMDTFVPGRRVFDNATITARLTGDMPATIAGRFQEA
jgi:hypothetical protein